VSSLTSYCFSLPLRLFPQPFDLTDMDWSPELLIASHDDDEQNARLARHVWDDNGLDVPEAFLADLLNFLGMIITY